ncbi:MAG: ComEC/Rec2 family competence protein, partial [Candidatus Nealsonbacteria bacterium]|nr:ComEC/Rec2 family competence protein [Candidatus Nealsonbacteria bacterium]
MAASKILFYFCLIFILGVFVFTGPGSEEKEDSPKEVSFAGLVVAREPVVREKDQRVTVAGEDGRILLTLRRYPEYRYGDKLNVKGKLELPAKDINGFNYRGYLKKDGIYGVMSFPEVELAGRGFGNPVMSFLLSFKNLFQETARKFIPRPEIGFLEALVFGEESEISQSWKEKLNLTGTRHIAAVSGMNITLISVLLLNFLLALGLWRSQAFYLSLAFIAFYILMIGAPSSALRAGIMAGIFLTAQHWGRQAAGSRAVVFASSIMLASNPWLLRLDVGFQLSFLATMGLIYLQPLLLDWLRKIPNFFQLRYTLAATLAAQIFTLPILIYNFGSFSLISVFPNLLIVPLLAPITILIFIFGFLGMAFWPLGWLFSFPVFLGLRYLIGVVDFFSKIS